jgi:hypothetical protein
MGEKMFLKHYDTPKIAAPFFKTVLEASGRLKNFFWKITDRKNNLSHPSLLYNTVTIPTPSILTQNRDSFRRGIFFYTAIIKTDNFI